MTIQTSIWLPPSCCGCRIQLTGDFTDGSVVAGVSYRHPIPFTVTAVKALNICVTHQPNAQAMMDTSVFFDTPQADALAVFLAAKSGATPAAAPVQNRGYLRYPIGNPTPDQCLYTFLSQHGGTVNRQPCGCTGFIFADEAGNTDFIQHPLHTRHCAHHQSDTPDLKQAQADCLAFAAQAAQIDAQSIAAKP